MLLKSVKQSFTFLYCHLEYLCHFYSQDSNGYARHAVHLCLFQSPLCVDETTASIPCYVCLFSLTSQLTLCCVLKHMCALFKYVQYILHLSIYTSYIYWFKSPDDAETS